MFERNGECISCLQERERHGGIYEDPHFHLLSILEEPQFTDFDIIDKKGGKVSVSPSMLFSSKIASGFDEITPHRLYATL